MLISVDQQCSALVLQQKKPSQELCKGYQVGSVNKFLESFARRLGSLEVGGGFYDERVDFRWSDH